MYVHFTVHVSVLCVCICVRVGVGAGVCVRVCVCDPLIAKSFMSNKVQGACGQGVHSSAANEDGYGYSVKQIGTDQSAYLQVFLQVFLQVKWRGAKPKTP